MPDQKLAFGAIVVVVGVVLMATAAGAQAPQPSAEADGLLHVSLALSRPPSSVYPPSLDPQVIDLAFAPDLSPDAQPHLALLAGTAGSRVRVGTLEAHRALRLGAITPDLATPIAITQADSEAAESASISRRSFELWLTSALHGWALEAHESDGGVMYQIPLSHRATDIPSPVFAASVAATAVVSGRLGLRWGRHAWSADFRFDALPRAATPLEFGFVGDTGTTDAVQGDISFTNAGSPPVIARRNRLAERNETAVVLPDGSRISVFFHKGIDVEDEDYGRLFGTAEGDVVQLIRAAPPRLKTDVTLRFGQTALPTGNLAAGFAGLYAVWLRKVEGGWRLVFNHEADSWGTQYDAAFDAAEVDAVYSRVDGSFRPLGVTLSPAGDSRGRLVLHWGPHEWAADFVIGD